MKGSLTNFVPSCMVGRDNNPTARGCYQLGLLFVIVAPFLWKTKIFLISVDKMVDVETVE